MLTDYEWQTVVLSIKVASVAVMASLPFGIAIAWLLARRQFWGKSLLNNLIQLPLVLPPVVIGYLLLISMGRQGFIGKMLYDVFGLNFSFSWLGAALASAIVAFPLMVRAIRQSIESIDTRLEDAAKTLGANSWKILFTLTLPLALPGILAGAILAFARSLGEFGATIMFVSNIPGQTRTLPLAMYTYLETPNAEFQAMRLCIIAIVLSVLSLFASEWLIKLSKKYQS